MCEWPAVSSKSGPDSADNPDQCRLRRSRTSEVVPASGAQIALVYYASHGVQVDGCNYLILLTGMRAEVVAATKNKQVPWSNFAIPGSMLRIALE